jgi:predicted SnoaL-like aldol condensation-catalyzing enzyme
VGTQENKANSRRFLDEVLNRGNVAVIDELTGPNFVDHSLPPGVPPGNEGIKAFFTGVSPLVAPVLDPDTVGRATPHS